MYKKLYDVVTYQHYYKTLCPTTVICLVPSENTETGYTVALSGYLITCVQRIVYSLC